MKGGFQRNPARSVPLREPDGSEHKQKVDARRSGKASDEAEIRLLTPSSDQEGKVPPAALRSLEAE